MTAPLPTLADSRPLRLAFFAALYLAQGVPWGFVAVGYGVLLSDLGLDNAAVGAALGLAYLPWSFKVLWGPMLDATPALRIGRRRPYVIVAELLMGLTLLALCAVDFRTQLALATGLLFLNNTFAALQDVATDAMAVDVLQEEERGRANALMWAGKSLGVAVGGGAGLKLAVTLGWPALFLSMAVFVWAVALLPLLFRERPIAPDDRPLDPALLRLAAFLLPFAAVGGVLYGQSTLEGEWVAVVQPFVAVFGALAAWPLIDRAGFSAMRRAFSSPAPWLGVAVAVFTPVGYTMIQGAQSRLYRAELGLDEDVIATLGGVIDPLSGVVGALIGGWLADRYGTRVGMGGAMAAIGVSLLGFAAAPALWPDALFLGVWTVGFIGAVNAYNAASFGMFMGLSDPRVGATQFAVYMASTNLTYSWTAPFGGSVADAYGYPALFALAGLVQLASIAVLGGVRRR